MLKQPPPEDAMFTRLLVIFAPQMRICADESKRTKAI